MLFLSLAIFHSICKIIKWKAITPNNSRSWLIILFLVIYRQSLFENKITKIKKKNTKDIPINNGNCSPFILISTTPTTNLMKQQKKNTKDTQLVAARTRLSFFRRREWISSMSYFRLWFSHCSKNQVSMEKQNLLLPPLLWIKCIIIWLTTTCMLFIQLPRDVGEKKVSLDFGNREI